MFKRFIKYFLQGLLYTIPVAATIYIIYQAVILVDSLLPFDFFGIGLLVIIGTVTLFGFIGSTLISKQIFNIEKLIERIPLIKIIYTSVKDLLSAFVGKEKRFTEPVLVKMEGDVERFGFITQKDLTDLGIDEGKVGVYIPFSYAVTGNLIVVPKDRITPIDAPSSDIMKFIISGGVASIEEHEEDQKKSAD